VELERLALRTAVPVIQADPTGLATLDGLIDAMLLAARRQAWLEASKADLAFHRTMVETSGNNIVVKLWEALARHVLIVFGREARTERAGPQLVEQDAHFGSQIPPTSKPRPDGTLVKALARAWRWQRLLDEGVYSSAIEISDAEGISTSYVSRILQLALLAPDVVERVIEGSSGIDLRLEAIRASIPLSWDEQRTQIAAAGSTLSVPQDCNRY
jgi:hypothetical protein